MSQKPITLNYKRNNKSEKGGKTKRVTIQADGQSNISNIQTNGHTATLCYQIQPS